MKSLHRLWIFFKKQPRELKLAIIECTIICILAFAAPLIYLIPKILDYDTLTAAGTPFSTILFMFAGMILPFLLIILIGTVLYLNMKNIFNYPWESLFHGIIFSIFSMYTFLLYTGIISTANPLVVRPDNAHIYWLPIIFFFPLVHNSILVFREAYTRQKSSNFQIKFTITSLIGVTLVILATFVSLLEDAAFVREYDLTFMLMLPASVIIIVMYKLLFRKQITTRSIAYFPLALFLTYLISFNIAPGFPNMLTRSFTLTEYVSYMAVGCVVSVLLMLAVWALNVTVSRLLTKV
ncbi:hypothetical protein LJC08_06235, partial [Methanimicrococcus sp. OttesenSCG-928-J09]|nr:hypothetical protein [Methanimicrococcus sp. OttesenSCG-928-J09]